MTAPRRSLARVALVTGLLACAAAVLAGCASEPKSICPAVAVLNNAATVTKFDATGTQIAYRAAITDADLDCSYKTDLLDEMEVNMRIQLVAERQLATAESAELEYFVVVTDRAGNVIKKKVFPVELDFDGEPRAAKLEEIWQLYDLEVGGGGALYEIWVGFQLTDAELDFNRRTGG